ncbi:MAG: ABC transporter permease [Sphaerochaetaceae bacterium]
MFDKAFKSFDLVLRRAMVLMMAGLAVAIPMKSGMFNMGGEGQIIAGGLTAAIVGGMDLGLPGGIHMLFALLCAMLVGMLLAGFSALLSLKRNVSEVISTIMMNNILAYIVTWLVMNPFRGSEFSPQTKKVLETARIKGFPEVEFSWGLIFAVVLCMLTWFFLEKTPKGLELKAAGLNPVASRYQGINTARMGRWGMLLGGIAASLGGAFEVLGGAYVYTDDSFLQYGFDGIAIAFMASNNPIGIIITSIFMAMIRIGSLVVSRKTGVSTSFVSVFQGLIITLLVVPSFSDSIFTFFKRIFSRKQKMGEVLA